MKLIGNAYIQDEFKRHHDKDNEKIKLEQYKLFLQEWQKYLVEIKLAPKSKEFQGRNLSYSEMRSMTDEQKETLEGFRDHLDKMGETKQ